uniref:Uncharacterized protein n=1 Tax=Peronospora matthiolae TaxID=2874970 RepID=A0AAV1T7X9_9STRA
MDWEKYTLGSEFPERKKQVGGDQSVVNRVRFVRSPPPPPPPTPEIDLNTDMQLKLRVVVFLYLKQCNTSEDIFWSHILRAASEKSGVRRRMCSEVGSQVFLRVSDDEVLLCGLRGSMPVRYRVDQKWPTLFRNAFLNGAAKYSHEAVSQ